MESFATIINKVVKKWFQSFPSYILAGFLYDFHVALFSCCTFLILKNIENEGNAENNQNLSYTQYCQLAHIYFDNL